MTCPENPREDWVPNEIRNIDRMKMNTGKTAYDSFVYFPKKQVEFVEGVTFNCIEIPVGTQFYKGIGGPVDDPEAMFGYGSWYSDYTTAKLYTRGTNLVYAYSVITPLYLINIVDEENIEKLMNLPEVKQAEKMFNESYRHQPYVDPYNGRVDTDEEGRLEVLKEFKYKTPPILRSSSEFSDKAFAGAVKYGLLRDLAKGDRKNVKTMIQGFYTPTLPSTIKVKCPVNSFHREIYLFISTGNLKYNPSNKPLGGSSLPLLRRKSRRTVHHRKTANRSSLRPKNRSRTNRNRRSF
jgi:hypothetical protein